LLSYAFVDGTELPNKKPPPSVIRLVTIVKFSSGIVPVSNAIIGATTTMADTIFATGLSSKNPIPPKIIGRIKVL